MSFIRWRILNNQQTSHLLLYLGSSLLESGLIESILFFSMREQDCSYSGQFLLHLASIFHTLSHSVPLFLPDMLQPLWMNEINILDVYTSMCALFKIFIIITLLVDGRSKYTCVYCIKELSGTKGPGVAVYLLLFYKK